MEHGGKVPLRVIAELDGKQIDYELIDTPRPIRSVLDGVQILHIEAGQTAPTLILNSEQGFYAAIVSGARGKLDLKAVGALLGCQAVTMAAKREMQAVTGYEPGQIPLTGHGLPCIIDRMLLRHEYIYGGTGQGTVTLKIKPQALYAVNAVIAELADDGKD